MMMECMTAPLSTKLHRFTRGCFLLGLALSLLRLPVLAENATTFKFAPPDGMTYTETTRTKSTTQIAVAGHREKEVTEQVLKTKTDIHQTADGFTITETVLSVDETKEGKDTDPDSFLKACVDIPITYHIGKDGKLLAIDGIQKIVQSCKENMPPDELRTSGYPGHGERHLRCQ